jgi:alcohol dehydrogenase class IV
VNHTLCELGMTKADLPLLAENALADACMLTNPRQPTASEVIGIYEKAC